MSKFLKLVKQSAPVPFNENLEWATLKDTPELRFGKDTKLVQKVRNELQRAFGDIRITKNNELLVTLRDGTSVKLGIRPIVQGEDEEYEDLEASRVANAARVLGPDKKDPRDPYKSQRMQINQGVKKIVDKGARAVGKLSSI